MESPTGILSETPANHARACVSCARAKAKCVLASGPGSNCQRCQRLKRVCEPAVPQPRTHPRKRRPPTATSTNRVTKSKVDKLEEKLDGLVTLLISTQDNVSKRDLPLSSAVTASSSTPESSAQKSVLPSMDPERLGLGYGQGLHHIPRDQTAPSLYSNTEPSHCASLLPMFKLSDGPAIHQPSFAEDSMVEANSFLNTFRNEMSPFFPFITLPPLITAQELRQQRPFLFLCIKAVTSRNTNQQLELGKTIMKQLAERMFVNGERNLDLLLGVLTYVGFSYYLFFNVPALTSLIAAAMTLVWDLGLTRNVSKEKGRSLFENAIRETSNLTYFNLLKTPRTPEEKRALLGVFFISSVATLFFRRTDTLRFSPHLEECLQSLADSGDHPNDRYIVAMVRLQLISEKIYQCPWHAKTNELGISAPIMMMVNSLQEQMLQFKRDFAMELQSHDVLPLQYHAAEIAIYEVSLSRLPSLDNSENHNFRRLDLLYSCLRSVQRFFDIFLSIPTPKLFSFAVPSWSTITYPIIALQALSTFDHPDWDLAYVRQSIDFFSTLEQFMHRFERMEADAGYEDSEYFSRCSKKMSCIKAYCEQKMLSRHTARSQPGTADYADPEGMSGSMDFPELDEDWLREMLGAWDLNVIPVALS